jgi:hypothetical protein
MQNTNCDGSSAVFTGKWNVKLNVIDPRLSLTNSVWNNYFLLFPRVMRFFSVTTFDVFLYVESCAHFIAWNHSLIHKVKHNISLHKIPNILTDSDRSFNIEVKDR